MAVHQIKAGREFFGGRNRTIWDCPHTYTLRMWHQSLAMLHQQERYDLLCAFFLYPMGYLAVMLARQHGLPAVVGLMGNDIKKYLFSPEKVGMCRAGLEGGGPDRVGQPGHDRHGPGPDSGPQPGPRQGQGGPRGLPCSRRTPGAPGTGPAATFPVRLCRVVQVRQGAALSVQGSGRAFPGVPGGAGTGRGGPRIGAEGSTRS